MKQDLRIGDVISLNDSPQEPLGQIIYKDDEFLVETIAATHKPFRKLKTLREQFINLENRSIFPLRDIEERCSRWNPTDVSYELGVLYLKRNISELSLATNLVNSVKEYQGLISTYLTLSNFDDKAKAEVDKYSKKMLSTLDLLSMTFPKSNFVKKITEDFREKIIVGHNAEGKPFTIQDKKSCLAFDIENIDFRGDFDTERASHLSGDNWQLEMLDSGLSKDEFTKRVKSLNPEKYLSLFEVGRDENAQKEPINKAVKKSKKNSREETFKRGISHLREILNGTKQAVKVLSRRELDSLSDLPLDEALSKSGLDKDNLLGQVYRHSPRKAVKMFGLNTVKSAIKTENLINKVQHSFIREGEKTLLVSFLNKFNQSGSSGHIGQLAGYIRGEIVSGLFEMKANSSQPHFFERLLEAKVALKKSADQSSIKSKSLSH